MVLFVDNIETREADMGRRAFQFGPEDISIGSTLYCRLLVKVSGNLFRKHNQSNHSPRIFALKK